MTLLAAMLRLLIAWAMAQVATARTGASFTPTLFFNFSVSPLSPSLSFIPDMQTNTYTNVRSMAPWNTTFSDSPWSSYVPGQVGVGRPRTFIRGPVNGGPLEIDYTGNGLYFAGEFELFNRTQSFLKNVVTIYGDRPSDDTAIGAPGLTTFNTGVANMPLGNQFGGLTVSGTYNVSQPTYVALDAVTFGTGMQTNATTLADVKTQVEYAIVDVDSGPALSKNLLWQQGGQPPHQWQVSTELNGVGQSSTPYPGQRTAVTTALTDKFGMYIPRGTAFIVVNGTTGPTKGVAQIVLKPDNSVATFREAVLTNPWVSVETIFWAPLNPSVQYNMSIVPLVGLSNITSGNYSNGVGLHSVTLYAAGDVPDSKASDGSTPGAQGGHGKSNNTAAIAGGVAGGVVALAVIAGLVWFLRRKKQNESKEKFHIEEPPPDYKNVNDGGYTNAALSTSPPATAPLHPATYSDGSSTPTSQMPPVTHAVDSHDAPFQPAVMHAVDSEDIQAIHALDSEDVQAVHAVDSEDVPSGSGRPLPSIPSASSSPTDSSKAVAMPQYKLDALLGIRPGDRSGKAANSIVRVPQEKLDLLNNIRAPEPGPSDRVVSMPQHKLEALLGMMPSANEADTVLSLPQYKLDALLAVTERPPPSYYG